jgi:hypothetical protein
VGFHTDPFAGLLSLLQKLPLFLLQILCVCNYPSACFYLKYTVSETEFCLRLQVKPTQFGPIGRAYKPSTAFLRVLRFPLPFIPPNSPSSQSPGAGTIGYNRPVSGRRAEWTQFGLHPPLCKFKKKKNQAQHKPSARVKIY